MSKQKEVFLKDINLEDISINKELKTYTLEIITPLGIHGSTKKAEIREQSINGVLRYWSRALRVDSLTVHSEKVENIMFGSSLGEDNTKSLTSIQIDESNIPNKPGVFLPSKSHPKAKINTLKYGQKFKIKLSIEKNKKHELISLNEKEVDSWSYFLYLFILVTMIGGFGQRSRHGLGSVSLLRFNNEEQFKDMMNQILEKYLNLEVAYDKKEQRVYRINPLNDGQNYWTETHILNVRTNNVDEIMNKIKNATHNLQGNYKNVIGSFKPRMPSPLHTSVSQLKNGRYLVTVSEVKNNSIRDLKKYNEAKAYYLKELKRELSK